ncbi:MAG: hypothetical protein ACRCTS_02200 [Fusobacteriaceae bacterium]
MDEVMKKEKNKCSSEAESALKELYSTLPYYAAYETFFNQKAGYDGIIKNFQDAKKHLVDEKTTGLYLMTLVDTLENISEEIFEHYRNLQLVLKEIVVEVIDTQSQKDSSMIAYAIMKGVRLNQLSEEYLEFGVKNFENLVHNKPRDIQAFMMAYSEYLYLKNNLE